jgi:hypothetical protein
VFVVIRPMEAPGFPERLAEEILDLAIQAPKLFVRPAFERVKRFFINAEEEGF